MFSLKKIIAVTLVSVALVVIPMRSQAIVPIIAAWLLELTGGSLLIGDLVAAQTGVITAIMWWDCNKFALSAPCTSKTPIPSTQQPRPAITVNLKPDTKRSNPDPKKFNDPAAGSSKRDVTPKPVITASGKGPPETAQGIPGVPVVPSDLGVLIQAPRKVNVGAAGVDENIQRAQYNASYSAGGIVTGIEVVPQLAPASAKAIPFIALHTTCVRQPNRPNINCSEPILATEAYLRPFSAGKYFGTVSIDCCAVDVLRYVTVVYLYNQSTDVTVKCDPGYADSGKDASGNYLCSLTDATKVKKPDDTTCEVLFDADSKLFLTDKANPACDGINDTKKLTLSSTDGSKTVEVGMNAGNGFDIGITKKDGSKTGLDTGVYDPSTGGYVIVHVYIVPPEQPDNGLGCGGPGQGVCSMVANTNADMQETDAASRTSIDQANTGLKGKMDNIDPNKFQWSFIPQIPTTACTNPSLRNPVTGGTVEMDICGGFNKFTFFLNAVLAIACVYGCVRQVQGAIKA